MTPAVQAVAGSTISIDDFMTGLIASLSKQGITAVSIRDQFYVAAREAFRSFRTQATHRGHEVDFTINLHPVHGDSPLLRMAITQAVQRDLVSLDNPVYLDMRIRVGRAHAHDYLESLPGGADLYESLAVTFMEAFASSSDS